MSAEDASGFVTLVETIFQSNYCAISATALLLYDWIITLDREKAFVWSRRRSVASVLYIFGRLVGPSSYITSMFLFSALTPCRVAILFEDVTSLFPYVFWAVFSGFRAHALSARNKAVAGVVLVLNLVPVGLNAYIYYFSQAVNYPPPLGCAQAYNGPNTSAAFISMRSGATADVNFPPAVLPVSYCSRGSIILAECIVIALTWKETWSFRHAKHIAGETTATRCGRKSVGEVLLVNGTFCFGVSLVLNVLTLVFTNIASLLSREHLGLY
ncbi:hypothetical protein BD414DRAFT_535328 [Trametes punicea]|nr:hypothetical protein BD414DRAFT_535328 [Trametes punicea]